jgi:hypothetical protein
MTNSEKIGYKKQPKKICEPLEELIALLTESTAFDHQLKNVIPVCSQRQTQPLLSHGANHLAALYTKLARGTVRSRPPFPTISTTTQWLSLNWS